MSSEKKKYAFSWLKYFGVFAFVACHIGLAFADASSMPEVVSGVTSGLEPAGKLMAGFGYTAGIGSTIAAIFKFQAHKNNPTQIPIHTPIALLAIGLSLIATPGIVQVVAGSAKLSGGGAGFSGIGVSSLPGGTK